MFAVNFAGVGGTQHGTWSQIQFLQKEVHDVMPSDVSFPEGDMFDMYKRDPDAFCKETVRLGPTTHARTHARMRTRTRTHDANACTRAHASARVRVHTNASAER